jgi:hypothetical protein
MDVSGQLHALFALPPGKEPPYLLDSRWSGPHNLSGRDGKKETPVIAPLGNRAPSRSYPRLHHTVEVKIKLSLRLSKHHAMKTYWRVEVHAFLTSALVGVSGQLHAPAALPPGKEQLVRIG